MGKIYYFKDIDDVWSFSNGIVLPARRAITYVGKLRAKGITTERLYLDKDFERIKSIFSFYREGYWEGATPSTEYFKKHDTTA